MKTEILLFTERGEDYFIDVDFSPEEIERIGIMRDAHDTIKLDARKMTNGELLRDLYLNAAIPWGYWLQNREKTFNLMEERLNTYQVVLENIGVDGYTNLKPYEEVFRIIVDTLQTFIL